MLALLDIRGHSAAFREALFLFRRHYQLTWEMTRREISDKYAGQVLGKFWAIGHPLALMAIYVLVFSFIFRMKIGGTAELPLDYTAYLLSGIIPWLVFQESMSKASTVIVNYSNLVKQVVFPLEILPVKGALATLPTQIVSTLILISYVLVRQGYLYWTYVLIPFLFLLQIIAMIGVAFILSSVGAYFRDLKDFVLVFCTANFYMMPMIFVPRQLPSFLEPIFYFNPFSYLIWCYQDALYFGRFEHPWAWSVSIILSGGTFLIGYRIFRKLKLMFGNVL